MINKKELVSILTSIDKRLSDSDLDLFDASALFICGLIPIAFAIKYVVIKIGGASPSADYAEVWSVLGSGVINGQALYLSPQTIDNKPPLFLFEIIGAHAVGQPILVLYLLMSVGLIITIWLTYKIARNRSETATAALVSTMLVYAMFNGANAYNINNEQVTIPLILFAVWVVKPQISGLFTALGTLSSVYAFGTVPIFCIYFFLNREHSSVRYLLCYVVVLLAVWSIVWMIWGFASVRNGLIYSLGSGGSYIIGESAQFIRPGPASPIAQPSEYLSGHIVNLENFTIQLVVAIAGAIIVYVKEELDAFDGLIIGVGVAQAGALIIRPYNMYWILLAPTIGYLISFAIDYVILLDIS